MKMRIIHDNPWKILGYHGIPGLSGPFFFSSFRNGMPWWRDPPPVSIILFGLKGGYGCTQSLQVISWTYSQYYNMYIYIFNYIYTLKARCCCLLHPMYRSHPHHSSLDCAGQCCKKHPLIGLMGFQPPTQQVGYNPIWWVVSVEIQPCMQPRPSGTLNMEALSHSNN